MKKKLIKMLSFLPEGKGLQLGNDTFLCTGGLDGSDKIYGFIKNDGDIFVISRQNREGSHIEDMDKGDLDYIFNGSSIAKKIEKIALAYKNMEYAIVEAEEV